MTHPFPVHKSAGYFQVLRPVSSDESLSMAKHVIRRWFTCGLALTRPDDARDFLHLELAALKLIDVRVLDHFIIGGSELFSFAEQRLL